MGPTFENEGHENVTSRRHARADVTLTDAQKAALKLIKATRDTHGSLAEKDGATVLFSQGACRVRSDGDLVTLEAEGNDERALEHVEDVMTGHLRTATGEPDLQVDWSAQD